MIGAVFILYSFFKNNFSKTDLTKKLIIPSFVILFLSLSIIWDPLVDIAIVLFPIFLIFFVIYYIKKNKADDSAEVKSLKFFMTVTFKVLYIILTGCVIFILLFLLLIPAAILKDKQLYEYLRIVLMILNFSNILYYFKLNFLNEFKNSISDISQNDLFRLEKEAEIRQKKRYFLGMEFNKIYFSIFGFFIIPIIKNFLDYVKRKSNLSLENSVTNFFREYGNIFSVSVTLFAVLIFFVIIFDNMSYLSRNTVFKNITKVLGILIEEKLARHKRLKRLFK